MKQLIQLFLSFAKVGIMTFGGGYAMLPLFEREVVEKRKWASNEEMLDYYAVGQCTPGAIAVNVATFVGQKVAGIPGGIAATVGVVFPSFVIIVLLAGVIKTFSNAEPVKNAFGGIRICACVLILNAVKKLFGSAVKDKISLVIFGAVFIGTLLFKCDPIVFVLLSAVLGVIIQNFKCR